MAEIAGLLGGYGSEDDNSVKEPSPVPKTSPPSDDVDEKQQAHRPLPDDGSSIPAVAALPPQLEDHPTTATTTTTNHSNFPLNLETIPLKECDPALASRVASWLQVQRTHGRNLKEELRKMRDYRNPEFFKKMVEYLEIEPCASAFNPEVFDPEEIREEDRLEGLRRQWREEEESRRVVRSQGGRVEFVQGSSSGEGGGGGHQQQKGGGSDVQQAIAAASTRARALALQLEQRANYNNRP